MFPKLNSQVKSQFRDLMFTHHFSLSFALNYILIKVLIVHASTLCVHLRALSRFRVRALRSPFGV